jgi:hypothetical protein
MDKAIEWVILEYLTTGHRTGEEVDRVLRLAKSLDPVVNILDPLKKDGHSLD